MSQDLLHLYGDLTSAVTQSNSRGQSQQALERDHPVWERVLRTNRGDANGHTMGGSRLSEYRSARSHCPAAHNLPPAADDTTTDEMTPAAAPQVACVQRPGPIGACAHSGGLRYLADAAPGHQGGHTDAGGLCWHENTARAAL